MNLQDHLRAMADYHHWASERLYASADQLGEADYRSDQGLYFKSVHGTLNHLLLVERLWRSRINGQSPQGLKLGDELEPDRAALRTAIFAEIAEWRAMIAAWGAAELERVIDFATLAGKQFRLPLPGIALGTFNHATHHRGQITAALTRLGAPSPEMCLPYYLITATEHWLHG